jgi:hypothetical protein
VNFYLWEDYRRPGGSVLFPGKPTIDLNFITNSNEPNFLLRLIGKLDIVLFNC